METSGGEITYDRLVVELGVELAPEPLRGFADGGPPNELDNQCPQGRFDGRGSCFVELGFGQQVLDEGFAW